MLEKQVKTVFISIGSNLGNKKRNIELAKFELKINDINIIKSSSYYETFSWPDKTKPKFINVVLKIETYLYPNDLMKKFLNIEKKLGRKRNKKNEPRIIDIDIIDYDNKILKKNLNNNLSLPHPKMHKRNFVLLPLFEVTKIWIHPVKNTSLKNLINSLKIEELRAIKLL
tara:strand:+ start:616 stop:1125 length:510 start_codon:yes stop_codon:yes gene_type:complete